MNPNENRKKTENRRNSYGGCISRFGRRKFLKVGYRILVRSHGSTDHSDDVESGESTVEGENFSHVGEGVIWGVEGENLGDADETGEEVFWNGDIVGWEVHWSHDDQGSPSNHLLVEWTLSCWDVGDLISSEESGSLETNEG